MQGVHVFEPHAKTVIDLELFVEQDHLLRKIDRVLDMAIVVMARRRSFGISNNEMGSTKCKPK